MRIDFDWDPDKAASNVRKHGVTFEQAMAVFRDPLSRSILDRNHEQEERWVTLGEADIGLLLVVVHTWSDIEADRAAVRIISARPATRKEAQQYREDPIP